MYNNNDGFPPYRQQDQGTKLRPRKSRLLKFLTILTIITTASTLILIYILIGVFTSNHGSSQKVDTNPGSASTQIISTTPPTSESASATTSLPTPTLVSTSASTVGTVLCHYDASSTFQNWTGSSEWKVINDGTYGSDGNGDGTGVNGYIAWSGCQPQTANYVVEAQIQYVRSTSSRGAFEFGIMLRGDGDGSGYEVGGGFSRDCGNQTLEKVMVTLVRKGQPDGSNGACGAFILAPLTGSSASEDYQFDTQIHTYRAEISGNTLKLSLDGHLLLETSDNTYTDAGQVGLRDRYGSINVKSFNVIVM